MAERIEDINIQSQERVVTARGPTSSSSYNDSISETVHDLATISDQWNNRLVPLTSTIPNGTVDSDVDAFLDGLDGKTLYTDSSATAVYNASYYNTSKSRPNTVYEQIVNVYASIETLSETIEDQLDGLSVGAASVSILDSASLYDAVNVEGALAEVMATVNLISYASTLDLSAIDQDYLPAADVTYDIGSTVKRIQSLYLSGSSLYINSKISDTGSPPAKTFTWRINTSTGNLELLDGATTVAQFSSTSVAFPVGVPVFEGQLTVAGNADTEQLIVKANSTQTITNPLIQLQNSGGGALMDINTNRVDNVFIGLGAGNACTNAGANNVYIGADAGGSATEADTCTAVGANALATNISGANNTAFGAYALNLTTGTYNTAVGRSAGAALTTGAYNVLLGSSTGDALTEGTNNVAVGHLALSAATTVSNNTAIGDLALTLATGASNTAVGSSAAFSTTIGTSNTVVGQNAMYYNVEGDHNTVVGRLAGQGASGQTYENNTLIGSSAGLVLETGGNNVFVGYQAGLDASTAASSIFIGYQAGANVTTIAGNTYVGHASGSANIDSVGNTGLGYHTLRLGTGGYNTAVGYQAGDLNVTGANNTSMGYQALHTNTSSDNTAVGFQALLVATGASNTAVGSSAGTAITTGVNNICVGYQAGQTITTGLYNTAIGYQAMQGSGASNTDSNTCVGGLSGGVLTTGSWANTFLGRSSGAGATTGDGNIFIGYNCGSNITTGEYNIFIGHALTASVVGVSNELNIGDTIYGNTSTKLIGINTIPESMLHLKSNASFYQYMEMDGSFSGSTEFYMGTDNSGLKGSWEVGCYNIGHATHAGKFYIFQDRQVDGTLIGDFKFAIDDDGLVGIGTGTPNAQLTVEGAVTLDEIAAPAQTAGYGTLYTKSSDTKLYFKTSAGIEYDVTATGATGALTGQQIITGNANEEQLVIKAFPTQGLDVPLIQLQKSDGTPIGAFHTDDISNIFLGIGAGEHVTSGMALRNILIGNNTGNDITTGDDNIIIGDSAASTLISNDDIVAIGSNVLNNVTGAAGGSVYIGKDVCGDVGTNIGGKSVFIGEKAGYGWHSTDDECTYIGYYAGGATEGGANSTVVGAWAGYYNGGTDNVALGLFAGSGFSAGSEQTFGSCVCIGAYTGNSLETGGNNNTFVGYDAGEAVTTGANNILIGSSAGNEITTGDGNIIIGYDLDASAAGVDDEINIGGLITGSLAATKSITFDTDHIIIATKTPASAGATGTTGMIAWDSGYLYVCVGTDEWERAALATWV